MELQPAVTVVIPMLNASGHIATLLDSLWAQDFEGPWEIIAVDNGSVDGTAQLARELLEAPAPKNLLRGEVLLVPSPQGYATPRNAGARHSRAPLLAFCDADGAVDACWLSAMAHSLGEHPLVGSRLIRAIDVSRREFSCTPANPDHLNAIFGLEFASTAGLGCTTELLNALDGFDPYFDIGGEDLDFSMRARFELGVEPVLGTSAIYWTTRPRSSTRKFAKGYRDGRSQVRAYERHFDHLSSSSSGPTSTLAAMAHVGRNLVRLRHRRRYQSPVAYESGRIVGRAVWSIRLGVRCF